MRVVQAFRPDFPESHSDEEHTYNNAGAELWKLDKAAPICGRADKLDVTRKWPFLNHAVLGDPPAVPSPYSHSALGCQPELVSLRDAEGRVELGQVADDAVAAKFGR